VQTRIHAPNGVVAFRSNRYVVDGVIVNTGRQPIRSITFNLRLVQNRGSTSSTESIAAMDIMPGKQRPFTVDLPLFVGSNTTPPYADISNTTLDW
jgi:hypothetical protein